MTIHFIQWSSSLDWPKVAGIFLSVQVRENPCACPGGGGTLTIVNDQHQGTSAWLGEWDKHGMFLRKRKREAGGEGLAERQCEERGERRCWCWLSYYKHIIQSISIFATALNIKTGLSLFVWTDSHRGYHIAGLLQKGSKGSISVFHILRNVPFENWNQASVALLEPVWPPNIWYCSSVIPSWGRL